MAMKNYYVWWFDDRTIVNDMMRVIDWLDITYCFPRNANKYAWWCMLEQAWAEREDMA